jgi:DNA-binding MltR family transcriptional regulator
MYRLYPYASTRIFGLNHVRRDMPTFPSEEAIKRSLALVKELNGQTDRGVAIVGVAWIEEALVAAVHAFLEKNEKAWDRLFSKSGPLSSLSAKIDLARLIAMTSDAIHSDLHILRGIRNEFAHSVLDKDDSPLTFQSTRIRDRCLSLKCVKHEELVDPRHAFVRACAVLNADFYMHEFFGQSIQDGGRVVVHGE